MSMPAPTDTPAWEICGRRQPSWHVDQQAGIASLLGAVDGVDAPTSLSPRLKGKEDAWFTVVDGFEVLKVDSHGDAVEIYNSAWIL